MILAANKGSLNEFKSLCEKTEKKLNFLAKKGKQFKGGVALEEDVFDALNEAAKGTAFAGAIIRVSGLKFPDIKIGDNYGVEVKSNNTSWRSLGGSVLEASRIENIQRIYIMYGKLKKPVEFKTRPYEDCLYDVSVTHSPRYLIDMELKTGETIFDHMHTTYDKIRNSGNPIGPLLAYKKSENPNGNVWWSQEGSYTNSSSPFLIVFFHNLEESKKNKLIAETLLLFPQIFTKRQNKFEEVSLYWLERYSVMCHNIRDLFTASGKFGLKVGTNFIRLPHVFKTLLERKKDLLHVLEDIPPEILAIHWKKYVASEELKELISKRENLKILDLWQQIVLSQKQLIIEKGTLEDFFYQELEDAKSDLVDSDLAKLLLEKEPL